MALPTATSENARSQTSDAPTGLAGVAPFVIAAVLGAAAAGCGPEEPVRPPSLDGPSDIDVARRAECGEQAEILSSFSTAGGRCSIGLIANANSNRLAVADMGRRRPTLADLDPALPSITHMEVGRHPVDVAAGADGTAGYVLNAADGDISVVDLWRLEPTASRLTPPGTPTKLAARPGAAQQDRLVVATDDPDGLWFHDGVTCRRSPDGGAACQGLEADGTLLSTPGRVADLSFGPAGDRLYTVYKERDWMSVWALPNGRTLQQRGLSCVGGGTTPPCEVSRIGLRWGCADGLDNDGDGKVDQQDPQCFGPKGAESADGVGRAPLGACTDGEDNDGDGTVDRADPECLLAVGDSESEPTVEDPAESTCSDGVDNDGDGDADWPEDADCYGPNGRTEQAVDVQGFDLVDAGSMGRYVYIVSRGNAEVLSVDAERMSLVDAGTVEAPSTAPFTEDLGIGVGEWPGAVDGVVRRNIVWTDPEDPSHGIVQYLYGAWAASDDGSAYFAHTATAYCEVTETQRADLLGRDEFRVGTDAFQQSRERHCLTTPALPIERDRTTEACRAVDACRQCQDGDNAFDAMCQSACQDYRSHLNTCRTQGRLLEPEEDVRVAFNPRMSLRDSRSNDASLVGSGTCEEPDAYLDALRAYISDNPDAPDDQSCVSPLRPQPLSRLTSENELNSQDFDDLPRGDLLMRPELVLGPEDGSVTTDVATRPWDQRIRSESWTVTWEGVLPGTRREDGLFDDENAGQLDIGGLDACTSGVRQGDRLLVNSKPRTGGEAPEKCEAFVSDQNRRTWRTWRVAQVKPGSLKLATIDEPEDQDIFADELPDRECFPEGISYEIRAHDTWTAVGEQSGYVSERRSALGACVPRFGADSRRRASRVATGQLFSGPYLDFVLYDGPVEPLRRSGEELSYNFRVRRFFQPEQIGFAPDRVSNGGILPSTVMFVPDAPGGRRLVVGDASNDFLFVRNLDRANQENAVSILR